MLWPLLEHRSPARALQAFRSWASLSSCRHHHHNHNHHHHPHCFGPYWSTDRLQELSRHPDPGPISQVVIIIIIIITILIALSLLEHRPPTRALHAFRSWASLSSCLVCKPTSLFQPRGRGARIFLGGLAVSFPVGSRSGLDVWCRSWALEDDSNPSAAFLEEFTFCWLLLGSFPEFSGADGLGSLDSKVLLRRVLMNVWIFISVAAVVTGH